MKTRRNIPLKNIWGIGLGSLFVAVIVVFIILFLIYQICHFEIGDLFSLGQLIVEVLLIPIVIVGFYIAVKEYRISQQFPEVNLYWEYQNNRFEKSANVVLPPGHGTSITPRLMLVNSGNTVTTWYLVRIAIPKQLYFDNEPKVNRLIGRQITAIEDDPHWALDRQRGEFSIIFMSNGEFALYPDYPQPLCNINLFISGDKDYLSECDIPFAIYSDQGRKESGKLKLYLRRQ